MLLLELERGQDMGKDKKEKKSQNDIKKFLNHPIVSNSIGGLIVAVVLAGLSYANGFMALPKRVDAIEERMNKIDDRLDKIDGRIDKLDDKLDSIDSRVSVLEGKVETLEKAMELFIDNSSIYIGEGSSIIQSGITTASLSVKDNDIIAVSTSGKEYTAKELQNQRIITTYNQDGQEIIFCGQYNEKYHWTGSCIINAYKNGILTYAEVATYDDGKRTFNEQLFASDDNKTWIYVRRIQDGDINSGDTWKYEKKKDIEKTVNYNNPNERDLIIPGIFTNTLPDYISHYHGDTSESLYNDTSGEAYLLIYDDRGYIKTLYSGRFKDGQFDDDTGEAWYITRNKNTEYMYYKGTFKAGQPGNDKDKENPLSMETFEKVTGHFTCTDEMRWDMAHIE